MVAEIIVNSTVKTLNRAFHYIVPKELESIIKVGDRAFVPFGRKALEEGFVIGLLESSLYATKEIKSIQEGLTEENVKLAKLMARRYFCNISDCIKLMLPPGTIAKKLENRVKERTGNFVYLKKDKEEIESDIEAKKIKSPKQIRILNFLAENDGTHISDLLSLTDTTRAIIKTLEKNEYVEIVEEKIERNPFESKKIKRDKPYELTDEQKEAYDKVEDAIESKKHEEFLLYGVTGSRKNRNIYAINWKSTRKRKICNYASSRDFTNTSNDK